METEPPGTKLEDSASEEPSDPPKQPDGEDVVGVDADDATADDNVWGDEIGEAYGSGGLGLAGTQGTSAAPSGVPRVRAGAVTVSGRLPPEIITRIVRQNFGRFRMCYERGLAQNAALAGRVELRFVIERDGSVSRAVSGAGSDLPDPEVSKCVANSLNGVSFPLPEAGPVSVVFPILFEPPQGDAGH